MKIQVLGPGCAKCKKLYDETQKALSASGIAVDLEKVEKIEEIMKFGIMMTPALVIDGQVKSVGQVPKADEIARWITERVRETEAP